MIEYRLGINWQRGADNRWGEFETEDLKIWTVPLRGL